MSKLSVIAILLLLSCTGCAINQREMDHNPPLSPHHFSYDDLDVAWQAERSGDDVRITGTVRNARSYYLQNLELSARLVNEQDKVVARGTYAGFPDYLRPGTRTPFHLEFHLPPGTPVKKVHFSYIYWVFTAGEGKAPFRVFEDVPRSGTFASPL